MTAHNKISCVITKFTGLLLIPIAELDLLSGCGTQSSPQASNNLESLSTLVKKATSRQIDGEQLLQHMTVVPDSLPSEVKGAADDGSTTLEKGDYEVRIFCAGEGTITYHLASSESQISGSVECKPQLATRTVSISVGDDLTSTPLLKHISIESDKKINAVGGWAVYRS